MASVGLALRLADIGLHGRKITGMRPGVDARRRARLVVLHLLVERVAAQRRAAGAAFLGPVRLGQDGGIGEHGHARAVGKLADDGRARGGDVLAGADDGEAGVAQVLQGFEEGLVAPIQAMIAGKGDDIEARACQRRGTSRLRHHRVTRLRQTGAARGEAGLELAEYQLGAVEQLARGGKAFIRVLAVGGEIAGGQHDAVGDAHFAPAPAIGAGSPAQLPARAPQARSSGGGV